MVDYFLIFIGGDAAVYFRIVLAFIEGGVLAHQADEKLFSGKRPADPVQQPYRIFLLAGQNHMADNGASFHQAAGLLAVGKILEDKRAGLTDHEFDSLRCSLKIVRGRRVAPGKGAVHVFQIRQPDVYIRLKGADGFQTFISAAVVDDRDGEPPFDAVKGLYDRGHILSGCDQVDIVRALLLQFQKDIGKTGEADFPPKSLTADFIILTETAAQSTPGEKDGAASVYAADAGLFPLVQSSPGCFCDRAAATEARFPVPVDAAAARTEAAGLVGVHKG